ncbi:transposase [Mesorhizobium sp. M0437]
MHRLAAWLEQCGVKTVAMESTGVYWIPLFEILEHHGFDLILVNAREAKQVPGRKSDVSDAEWPQRLHEWIAAGSFRPTERSRRCGAISRRHRAAHYAAPCGASAIQTSWPLTVTHIARLQPRLFGRLSSATIGRSVSSLWRKRWSYTRYTKSRWPRAMSGSRWFWNA